jgi:hypothetical protein
MFMTHSQGPGRSLCDDLNRRVRGFYRQFDAARVRNFVGILVEGLVRRSIHSPALSPRV